MNSICVSEEVKRLKSLLSFDTLEESKQALVEPLINEIAFMSSELFLLKEQITIKGVIVYSNKGREKQTEVAKYYTKLVGSFSNTLRTVNTIIGKSQTMEDDELDKFLKGT